MKWGKPCTGRQDVAGREQKSLFDASGRRRKGDKKATNEIRKCESVYSPFVALLNTDYKQPINLACMSLDCERKKEGRGRKKATQTHAGCGTEGEMTTHRQLILFETCGFFSLFDNTEYFVLCLDLHKASNTCTVLYSHKVPHFSTRLSEKDSSLSLSRYSSARGPSQHYS